MRRTLPAVLASAVLALTSCAGGDGGSALPGRARVEVDTPQLARIRASAGIDDCAPGPAEPVDGGLPDVTLPCLGGGEGVDLSRLRGPMVVNLWASWCGPCREELPHYQAFAEHHGDRVPVLGIDYQDTQPRAALELARDTGVTYPLLADPQGDLDGATPFPRILGLPFLALVDEDGRVVHRQFVEIESEQQLVDLVDRHLGTVL